MTSAQEGTLRYILAGLIGAVLGGYAVARATNALPRVMSGAMSRMMDRMDPAERDRCREMMARCFGGDHADRSAARASRIPEATTSTSGQTPTPPAAVTQNVTA